jgi:cyclomaltodextrinase
MSRWGMTGQPPGWVRDAVFYQVFPDRFATSARVPKPGPMEDWDAPPTVHGFKGGDLRGVAERLDYLTDLGITAIYLNPIFASASNHRYHTYDYLQVDPLLGGEAAFRELLDAAHARGLRVIIDGVFNHSGRGFWPFHHILEAGRHSPYLDWFHLDRERLETGHRIHAYPDEALGGGINAVLAATHLGSSRSLAQLGYRAWWDLPALPQLNVANPHVRAYLLGVAEHWTRFGVDGWRLDVPEEVEAGFWHEFRQRVRAINPDAYLVGEVWRVAPEWTGDRFDGLMNYSLAWAIIGFAGGDRLDGEVIAEHHQIRTHLKVLDGSGFLRHLEGILAAYSSLAAQAHLNLLGSHDTPRLRTLCGGDLKSVQLTTLLQMVVPGAPCIYYGDEIGLEGRSDPDCRGAFPWDPSAWDAELRSFVRDAVSLREREPGLRQLGYEQLGSSGNACAFARGDVDQRLVVAVNAGDRVVDLALALPAGALPAAAALAVGEAPTVVGGDETGARLRLAPRSGAVLPIHR